MRVSDALSLSLRMFKARAMRTFLTVLGMSVGIGAILFLVSIGYGLQNALLERITTSDSLLTLDVAESKSGAVSLNEEVIQKFESMDGVDEVSPAVQVTAQGGLSEGSTTDMVIVGTRPSYFRLGGFRLMEGEVFQDQDPYALVMTSTLASIFSENPQDLLGKQINVTFFVAENNGNIRDENALQENLKPIDAEQAYRVTGIIENDEILAYAHIDSMQNLTLESFTATKVKCRSSESMPVVRDQILESGFLVSSLSDTVDQANKIFQIIQLILLSFGIIALVVSAIGMFNTMTIALLERTEEIGIMKSIGAFNFDVALLFVLESTIMGLLGGLGGVLLGQIGGEVMNLLLNVVATRFGGEAVDIFASPMWFVTLIIGLGAFVGFMTGFVPAMRASKIDPLDALRYK